MARRNSRTIFLVSLCGLSFMPMAVGFVAPAKAATPSLPANESVQQTDNPIAANARTMYSNTTQIRDGVFESRISTAPINYETSDNRWVPIDTAFSERSNGSIVNGANDFDITIPPNPSTDPVIVESDDLQVKLQFRNDGFVDGTTTDDDVATVDYAGAIDAVEYVSTAAGLKENVVLSRPPSTPITMRYDLNLSDGFVPTMRSDGSIVISSETSDEQAVIPAGVMYDSAPVAAQSTEVAYVLRTNGTGWVVEVRPDDDWLRSGERIYPVRIDPTVNLNATKDCWIGSAAPSDPHCSTNERIRAGRTGPNDRFRGLINFSTSNIPANARVTSAIVKLYMDGSSPNRLSNDYGLFRAGKAWSGQASWNSSGSNGAWDAGSPIGYTPAVTQLSGTDPGWKNFLATDFVQHWVSGYWPNTGLVLTPKQQTNNVLSFHSSAASFPPYVLVRYETTPPPEGPVDNSADSGLVASEVEPTLDGIFNCMKAQGLVSPSLTRVEALGGVSSGGDWVAPTASPAVTPSAECATGTLETFVTDVVQTADTPEKFDQAAAEHRTDLASGTEVPAPAPVPAEDSTSEPGDSPPYLDSGEGYLYARSFCPGYRVDSPYFLSKMNAVSDVSLPDFKWHSNNEDPCFFRWDDDVCDIIPDSTFYYDFTYPCKRHDFSIRNMGRATEWYSGSYRTRRNYNVADKQFKRDMIAHCATRSNPNRSLCLGVAAEVYTTVATSHHVLGYSTPWTFVAP